MIVDFIKLEIQSFKGFIDGPHVLSFRPDQAGLFFIAGNNKSEPRLGSNGAGKSSVWDCLAWTLYGRTAGGLKNPDITPWKGGKKVDCMLTVCVDGIDRKIRRTASPNRLTIDDKDAGQEAVDKLLGMVFDVFTQTVLLAQSQPLFFDMPPRDKMAMFANVLDLDRWDYRSLAASKKVSELADRCLDLENDITAIDAAFNEVEDMLGALKKSSGKWEQERLEVVESYKTQLKSAEKSQKKSQTKYNSADLEYDGAHMQIKLLDNSREKALSDNQRINKKYAAAEAIVRSLDVRCLELIKERKEMGSSDICPTCGQSLVGTALDNHKKQLKTKIDALKKQVKAGVDKKLVKSAEKATTILDAIKDDIEEFRDKASKADISRDFWRSNLATADVQVSNLTKSIESETDGDNPYIDQMSKLRRRRGKLMQEERGLNKKLNQLNRVMVRTKFWVGGFKDIRLYIIEDVLQELQLASNAMLEEVGMVGWEINSSIEAETKTGSIRRGVLVSIKSPTNEQSVKWECWSGGEGQRLRLIGALALSEVLLNHANIETGIEVLDEPTRHMSGEGVDDVCEFLADRANRLGKAIFYTDHSAIESLHFAGVTTIVKDKYGSHIEEGI